MKDLLKLMRKNIEKDKYLLYIQTQKKKRIEKLINNKGGY